MKSEQAEQNYAKFNAVPDRIDGAIHNTATTRLGVAFNYSAMEQIDAVEIAFTNEPHGKVVAWIDKRARELGGSPVGKSRDERMKGRYGHG